MTSRMPFASSRFRALAGGPELLGICVALRAIDLDDRVRAFFERLDGGLQGPLLGVIVRGSMLSGE